MALLLTNKMTIYLGNLKYCGRTSGRGKGTNNVHIFAVISVNSQTSVYYSLPFQR